MRFKEERCETVSDQHTPELSRPAGRSLYRGRPGAERGIVRLVQTAAVTPVIEKPMINAQ